MRSLLRARAGDESNADDSAETLERRKALGKILGTLYPEPFKRWLYYISIARFEATIKELASFNFGGG
ncbi:hypothetical protein BDZ91DRAFT_307590 [Kalaharituber pfeilii]|nr:hypothetical protein BDZ91DRAFT_307590 [Kalaharituber pfeilii]